MLGTHAIEHGSSRTGRWLRQHRYRFTLWLAAIEGLLYLVGAMGRWEAIGLAVVFGVIWFTAGRTSRSATVREVLWIVTAAQLLVLLVPILFAVVKAVAIAIVAVLAIVALIFLFTERR